MSARLSDIPPERLVEEVISRWDELVRVEEDLARSRQRVRALEMELGDQGGDGSLRAGSRNWKKRSELLMRGLPRWRVC